MTFNIDGTTVITSAIVSIIITSGNFITTRYLARALDKIEKNALKKNGNRNYTNGNEKGNEVKEIN